MPFPVFHNSLPIYTAKLRKFFIVPKNNWSFFKNLSNKNPKFAASFYA